MHENLPILTFNGYDIGSSPADIQAVIKLNDIPAVRLYMPLPTAKGFALALLRVVESYEKTAGHDIVPVEEMVARMETQRGNVLSVVFNKDSLHQDALRSQEIIQPVA